MNYEKGYRNNTIDIFRGILIILVVLGHSVITDKVHDIVYTFHMPLFFMLSGYLIKEDKLVQKKYIVQKIYKLVPPYITYLFLDLLFL